MTTKNLPNSSLMLPRRRVQWCRDVRTNPHPGSPEQHAQRTSQFRACCFFAGGAGTGFVCGKLPGQAKAPAEIGSGKTTAYGPLGDAHRKARRDQMFPTTDNQIHAMSNPDNVVPKPHLGVTMWSSASEPINPRRHTSGIKGRGPYTSERTCSTCYLQEGDTGVHHPVDQPLGPLRVCPDCGRQVCPVCYDKYLCCDQPENNHAN